MKYHKHTGIEEHKFPVHKEDDCTKQDRARYANLRLSQNKDVLKRGIKRNDLLVIGLIIALALSLTIISQVLSQRSAAKLTDGPYVVIQSPEGVVYSKPLAEDADLTIKTGLGSNEIKVADGAVWVERADCDNQVCVHTGKVSNLGDIIVCLPHQVIVQIVANPEDAALMNYGLSEK